MRVCVYYITHSVRWENVQSIHLYFWLAADSLMKQTCRGIQFSGGGCQSDETDVFWGARLGSATNSLIKQTLCGGFQG